VSQSGPLAITAYSLCNCLGRTTAEVVDSLSASRSGLGRPPFSLPFETVCGAVRGELPKPPADLSAYDAHQARIALQTFEEMRPPLAAAVRRWGADRVGIVMGTSTGGISVSEDAYDAYKKSLRLPAGYDYERQHTFFAFTELLRAVSGAKGPAYVVSTACSSSGKVLASARRLIAAGVADAVLVGGVDSLSRTTLCGFAGLGVLSATHCKPFALDRRGMNIGEGGAMLLIEREGDSRAMLLAVGESSDAHHMSSPHPEGLGARLAMAAALAEAGIDASTVDHINAHGTGTVQNDAAEVRAIAQLFDEEVPVVSTKGFTGHMLGAAGATEAIFAIIAVEEGWIPASLGASPPDPAFTIRINQARVKHPCRVALSSSFGFGGSNVAVLVGKP
jgi:3-oxoacyl-[acyl-carrier-protein] synthase-1